MPKHKSSLLSRFLMKVKKTDYCWVWTGAKYSNNYGIFWNGEKRTGAHRVSYELFKDKIPLGMNILHSCDNSLCVNPEHLFIGTQLDNMRDMHSKQRGRSQETYSQGEQHCNAIFTKVQVNQIRSEYKKESISKRALARRYNVDKRTMGRLLNKETYKYE